MDTVKMDIATQSYPTQFTYRVPHSPGKTTILPGMLSMSGWAGAPFEGKRKKARTLSAISRIAKRRNKRK